MIVLDENFTESQRQLLRSRRVPIRQIGHEVGRAGMKDDEIIPLLHQLRRPIFFSLDLGFYRRTHCHMRYCIVCLDVDDDNAATFVRRFLKHSLFESEAKRLNRVIRLSSAGIMFWQTGIDGEQRVSWS
jgi:hypothetical protein